MLVHTGQNYDHSLNQVFFDDLELRAARPLPGVDTSSLGRVLGETLISIEEVLLDEQPDAVLVLGDTNSCIAAVMAKRLRIPVYHMEAGNRCFDENVPEETNRRLVDHVADFNLVYTEHARRNLLAEGLHPRRILLTGSPMREVLEHYRTAIEASDVLDRLGPASRRVLPGQRPPRGERRLPGGWHAAGLPARRHANVGAAGPGVDPPADAQAARGARWLRRHSTGIDFHEPFGFHDYNRLQMQRGLRAVRQRHHQRGVAILAFPRHPARLDRAARGPRRRRDLMTGLDPDGVVEAMTEVAGRAVPAEGVPCPADYQSRHLRAGVDFILSTVRRHHDWAGIR